MINNQSQKGGDASTNFQAQQMVVNVGIDEKRAREIYQEMNLQVRKDYTQEALNIANTRVTEFENRLMPKMEAVDGALEAFADPGFQLLLVEAQKTAASTERPADYDLLSELLIHRFQKGENRIIRAGITRAVEIVDEISDEALLALTVSHAVNTFIPISGDLIQGLDVLNDFFGKILYRKLPVGTDWLDHADILDTVRLSYFGGMKKIQQFYPEILPGYIDVGIEKGSENHTKAIEILNKNNLPQGILIEHSLNHAFMRIPLTHRDYIDSIKIQISPPSWSWSKFDKKQIDLSKNQIEAIASIYDLYVKDEKIKEENINLFMSEWNKRYNLKVLKDWWDNINISFQITSVGKVLAHSNAQRCSNHLPPLN